jgi:hypothetical protein
MATVVPAPAQDDYTASVLRLLSQQQSERARLGLAKEGLEAEKAHQAGVYALSAQRNEIAAQARRDEAIREDRMFRMLDKETQEKILTSRSTRARNESESKRVDAQTKQLEQQVKMLAEQNKRFAILTPEREAKIKGRQTVFEAAVKGMANPKQETSTKQIQKMAEFYQEMFGDDTQQDINNTPIGSNQKKAGGIWDLIGKGMDKTADVTSGIWEVVKYMMSNYQAPPAIGQPNLPLRR